MAAKKRKNEDGAEVPEEGTPTPAAADEHGGDHGDDHGSDQAARDGDAPLAEDGASTDAEELDELFAVEDADVEVSETGNSLAAEIDHILAEAGAKASEAYRDRAPRPEAEPAHLRTRLERDRAANREAVVAEVIRSLLPAIDDLDRAASHGDLEGSPLELVAQKMRSSFERYGLRRVGEIGEPFDPALHEALVQLPSAEATSNTVADVIEVGYALGEKLVRPAKVAVSVPEN